MKTQNRLRLLSISAFCVAGSCLTLSGQTIIGSVSATESSHDTAFGQSVLQTYNGSGLSDASIVETGDPLPGLTANTHGTDSSTMWRTFITANPFGAPVDPNPVLTWDLGAAYDLDTIYYWNYAEFGEIDRGIQDVNISTSLDGVTFSSPTLVTLDVADGSFNVAGSSQGLVASNVQFVRFEIVSNYGDPDLVGLSEVRFTGTTVPEPATTAILMASFVVGLVMLRRRQRQG